MAIALEAAEPVDVDYTDGSQKTEFFSSGLEGVLIVIAAVAIAWYAIRRLFIPEPLHDALTAAEWH